MARRNRMGRVPGLEMAVAQRRPVRGVIHHSDHGSQYTALLFTGACEQATAYRWLSIMRGGHSCVTQFRNQEDTGGLERTRRARRLSAGGHARNRRDTEGHTVVPVRDREAPGSNPGPPTNHLNSNLHSRG